jgi:hypothetical protein
MTTWMYSAVRAGGIQESNFRFHRQENSTRKQNMSLLFVVMNKYCKIIKILSLLKGTFKRDKSLGTADLKKKILIFLKK